MPKNRESRPVKVDVDQLKSAAEELIDEVNRGFELVISQWKKPEVEITPQLGIKIMYVKPNLSQVTELLGILKKTENMPDDPAKFKEYWSDIAHDLGPIMGKIIVAPDKLRDPEFWESMDYPIELITDVIGTILGAWNQDMEAVRSFRKDQGEPGSSNDMGKVRSKST